MEQSGARSLGSLSTTASGSWSEGEEGDLEISLTMIMENLLLPVRLVKRKCRREVKGVLGVLVVGSVTLITPVYIGVMIGVLVGYI